MAAENRVYKVAITIPPNDVIVMRLIRAPNKTRALNHVSTNMIAVEVASQDDLIDLVGKGVKVEETVESTDEDAF